MITRQQVADLQPGDVVELRYDAQTVVRGHLRPHVGSGLSLHGGLVLRRADGDPANSWVLWDLTVVSRAPRPLYVNHPRTEPVPGDVVSRGDDDGATWAWAPLQSARNAWRSTSSHEWFDRDDFERLPVRLLVDGETGQVVQ